MSILRRATVPFVLGALLLAASPSFAATQATPVSPDEAAIVALTYDVTVAAFVEGDDAGYDSGYVAGTVRRPTAAPLPRNSPFTVDGFTISPGTTLVISVFSTKRVNDSLCITGTSTKTATVVYLSTNTVRPTLVRPRQCAQPGHPPVTARPSAKIVAGESVDNLRRDLMTVSIGEQSYATDNAGAFLADTVARPTKAPMSAKDLLVQQGVLLHPGDTVVATLFTQVLPNDSYCLTGTSTKTKAVVYLSSYDDNPTTHRPKGCAAPVG